MTNQADFAPVDDVIALDPGTGTLIPAMIRDGKPVIIKGNEGAATPSSLFLEEDGNVLVGSLAERKAHMQPDNFFSGYKPLMEKDGEAVLSSDGKFTIIDAFAAVFAFLFNLAMKAVPRFKGYPQFGGTKLNYKKLRIAVLIPAAGWGLQQTTNVGKALVKAGLPEEFLDAVCFFKEPQAAATAALAERGLRGQLRNRDVIAVLDFGAGTSDFSILEYRDGLLDTKCPHSGISDLGGTNETAAFASLIAEKLGTKFKAFQRGRGFSYTSSHMKAPEREGQFNLAEAGADMKHQFYLSDKGTVTVPTKDGNREVTITLDEARKALAPLYDEIEVALKNAFGDSDIKWSDVKFVVVAGGGCRTVGKLDLVAKVTGREVEDLIVCEEPDEAIACGGALMAWNPSDVDTSVVDAVGLTSLDANTGQPVNEVYIRNGETIPAKGLDVVKATTMVRSQGGKQDLSLLTFISKPQVLANEGDLLKDSEIVALSPVCLELELPPGEHKANVRMRFDVAGKAMCVLSFPSVAGSEAIVVPLQVADTADPHAVTVSDIIIIFDMSRSMEGEPFADAQRTTIQFVKENVGHGNQVAIVGLGMPKGTGYGVGTALPFTADVHKAVACIEGFAADGNTPMAASIKHAKTLCDPATNASVVLFTDGYATDEGVEEAASSLKEVAELFTIAIGESADHKLLESIATDSDHYFPVGRAADLKLVYETINTLLFTGEDRLGPLTTETGENVGPGGNDDDSPSSSEQSSGWDDEDDDDDASGWEEVA